MAIELETICRRCYRRWIPLHADFVRGTWRVCPKCRDEAAAKPAPKGGAS